jgi:hypothetical protein
VSQESWIGLFMLQFFDNIHCLKYESWDTVLPIHMFLIKRVSILACAQSLEKDEYLEPLWDDQPGTLRGTILWWCRYKGCPIYCCMMLMSSMNHDGDRHGSNAISQEAILAHAKPALEPGSSEGRMCPTDVGFVHPSNQRFFSAR